MVLLMSARMYKQLSRFNVLYFDRYGRVIAKYRQGQKWNGTMERNSPSWDYWYTLKLNNNKDDREL
jgi:gliding motility-associated-like protein